MWEEIKYELKECKKINTRWRKAYKLAGKKIINVPMLYQVNQSGECRIGIGLAVEGVGEKLSNEIIRNLNKKNQRLEQKHAR